MADLLTKPPVKIFDGEGGSYFAWSEGESAILGDAKVGAARLVLHPLGFALPHYSDSSKVALVLQGEIACNSRVLIAQNY